MTQFTSPNDNRSSKHGQSGFIPGSLANKGSWRQPAPTRDNTLQREAIIGTDRVVRETYPLPSKPALQAPIRLSTWQGVRSRTFIPTLEPIRSPTSLGPSPSYSAASSAVSSTLVTPAPSQVPTRSASPVTPEPEFTSWEQMVEAANRKVCWWEESLTDAAAAACKGANGSIPPSSTPAPLAVENLATPTSATTSLATPTASTSGGLTIPVDDISASSAIGTASVPSSTRLDQLFASLTSAKMVIENEPIEKSKFTNSSQFSAFAITPPATKTTTSRMEQLFASIGSDKAIIDHNEYEKAHLAACIDTTALSTLSATRASTAPITRSLDELFSKLISDEAVLDITEYEKDLLATDSGSSSSVQQSLCANSVAGKGNEAAADKPAGLGMSIPLFSQDSPGDLLMTSSPMEPTNTCRALILRATPGTVVALSIPARPVEDCSLQSGNRCRAVIVRQKPGVVVSFNNPMSGPLMLYQRTINMCRVLVIRRQSSTTLVIYGGTQFGQLVIRRESINSCRAIVRYRSSGTIVLAPRMGTMGPVVKWQSLNYCREMVVFVRDRWRCDVLRRPIVKRSLTVFLGLDCRQLDRLFESNETALVCITRNVQRGVHRLDGLRRLLIDFETTSRPILRTTAGGPFMDRVQPQLNYHFSLDWHKPSPLVSLRSRLLHPPQPTDFPRLFEGLRSDSPHHQKYDKCSATRPGGSRTSKYICYEEKPSSNEADPEPETTGYKDTYEKTIRFYTKLSDFLSRASIPTILALAGFALGTGIAIGLERLS